MGRVFLFFTALCHVFVSYGSNYKFRHYTDRDGLSSNTIQCLYQDNKGYVWIGTADGLDRFNSHDFTNYRYDYRRRYTIENNSVFSICAESVSDPDRIWVGTSNGVYVFDANSESFTHISLEAGGTEKINALVYSLAYDTGGNMWIATLGEGLFRYNIANKALEHYNHEKYPETFTSDVIGKVMLDSNNNVWVSCGSYILRYNPETDNFSGFTISDRSAGKTIGRVSAMCEDSFGDIWIAGYSCELYKFEISRLSFTSYTPEPAADFGRVRAMIEYVPGTIMMGTESGLVNFNIRSRDFEHVDSGTENKAGGLSDKFVHAIMKDRDGGLWIGTYFGGVNYLSPLGTMFDPIAPSPNCGRVISRMCEDADGMIWIGSDDGGLSCYNPATGSYKKVIFDPEHPSPNIHALFIDRDWLWIGTYGGGLYRMNLKTRRIDHFSHDKHRTDNLDVYSLFRDSRGELWVGTKKNICRYDSDTGEVVLVEELGMANSDVVDIKEDLRGNIWFASLGRGLICYDYKIPGFIYYSQKTDCGISDFVSCLLPENDNLWIGTHGNGICCLDIVGEKVTMNFQDTQYANCAIFQILISGGELWLTTNKGLLKYGLTAGNGSIMRYTSEDGLLANIFNPNSGIKTSTGHIYLGCNNGINRFYPYDLKRHENSTRLDIIFPEIKLFDKPVPITDLSVSPDAGNHRSLKLTGTRISVTIDFIAINFAAPLKTIYKYKLDNFNSDWITTGNEGRGVQHVSYSNLAPGEYRFIVSAASGSGQYGEEAVLSITVDPPLLLSRYMVSLYVLLAAGSVAALGYYIRKKIHGKHRKQIEALTRKNKIELLEAKVNLFIEVADEIRTPVSLISAPLEAIIKNPAMPREVDEDIDIIRKNCDRLLHLTDRMLNLKNSGTAGSTEPEQTGSVTQLPVIFGDRIPGGTERMQDEGMFKSRMRPERSNKQFLILLLENNQDFTDFFIRHFSEYFIVASVKNEEEALEVLRNKKVTAVVATLDPPRIDSVRLTSVIRDDERINHIPVIILSSNISAESKIRALKAGADAYLERPITIDHIRAQIESIMSNRQRLRLKFSRTPYFMTDNNSDLSGTDFLEQVNRYITDNISNPQLNVEDIAAAVRIGRSALFSRIKDITGTTPNEYLRRTRLKSAAELLASDNDLRVSEVCYMVGFSSTSYFAKCFQAEFGLLPNEFREKYQKYQGLSSKNMRNK